MDQQPNSISPTNHNTNSLLKIVLPQAETHNKQTYQWSYQISNRQASDFRNIFRSQEINKNNKHQYQCNPLDYGQIIVAKAIAQGPKTNSLTKQITFGPIGLEPTIIKYFSNPDKQNVSILLNKMQVSGSAKILTCPFVLNNNYKASILIKTEHLHFQLKIQKQIKLPANFPFFKFYAKQSNSLGLCYYHQQSEFLNKLRQLNIFVHSGHYLKLQFTKRQFRDAFLIQLMQYFGLVEQQLDQNQASVYKINTHRQRRTSNISGYSQNKRNGGEQRVFTQIDDEIFKILYNGEQQQKRMSFSFTDAEFLLSSMRKSGIQRIQNVKTLKQITEGQQKAQRQRNLTQKRIDYKKGEQFQGLFQIKNNEFHNRRSSKKFLKPHNYQEKNTLPFLNSKTQHNPMKEYELRNTISTLKNQIDSLIDQNKKLSQENKKLREENIKLRFKQIKKTFKQTFKQKGNNNHKFIINSRTNNPENAQHENLGKGNNKSGGLDTSKAGSIKNIRVSPRDSKKNLKLSSFGKNKQGTIESPGSNGTSQLSSNYNFNGRKKTQSNFASMTSVSNKDFIQQKGNRLNNKFIPRINTRDESLGNKSRSKNSKSQANSSFEKPDDTPSTPFFTTVTSHEAFSVKAYQSHFFRQYLNPKHP